MRDAREIKQLAKYFDSGNNRAIFERAFCPKKKDGSEQDSVYRTNYACSFIESVRMLYSGRNETSHDCVPIEQRKDLSVEETMQYGGALAFISRKMGNSALHQ